MSSSAIGEVGDVAAGRGSGVELGVRLPPTFQGYLADRARYVRELCVPSGLFTVKDAGVDFLAAARTLADEANVVEALEYLYMKALWERGFQLPVRVRGRLEDAVFLSGTYRGRRMPGPLIEGGPPPRVVIIGKNPTSDDVQSSRHLSGPHGDVFKAALRTAGIDPKDTILHWYTTTVVKHATLDPASNTVSQAWVKNCMPLLLWELALIQPTHVLCLGADAVRPFLKKSKMIDIIGSEFAIPLPPHPAIAELAPPPREARATASYATGHVVAAPEYMGGFETGISYFANMLRGGEARDDKKRHIVLYTPAQLNAAIDEMLARAGTSQVISVDCEWEGARPEEPGAKLLTFQWSVRPGEAFLVPFHDVGGARFAGGYAAAIEPLRRFLKSSSVREARIGGHFVRRDLEWVKHFLDIDLWPEYRTAESWAETARRGGWDTYYLAKAWKEDLDSYGLESLATRVVNTPRYEQKVAAFLAERKKQNSTAAAADRGYGAIPGAILHPYALDDADVTLRLFFKLAGDGDEPGLIDCDDRGLSGREGYWNLFIASEPCAEMERTGFLLDVDRGIVIKHGFEQARARMVHELRTAVGWLDFNPASVTQVRELLFGPAFNDKRDPETHQPISVLPEFVRPLGFRPVKATGKNSLSWDFLEDKGEAHKHRPSTDRETLGILAAGDDARAETAGRLRDLRMITQVINLFLKGDGGGGGDDEDDDDAAVGDVATPALFNGCRNLLTPDHDGRVRTSLGVVTTGRFSSSRPNLQNLSSRREADYKRILGDDYLYEIRSIFRADPGHVFVEYDYAMAELAVLGFMSGDLALLDAVRRNQLKASDPDYIDMHSGTAVRCFGLDCAPTKAGLESIGKIALRTGAKNVTFGTMYDRQAAAIARQCREEGNPIGVDAAQRLIDSWKSTYFEAWGYLEECHERVVDPRWLQNCFGLMRRFPYTDIEKTVKKIQRNAANFPIQSAVAGAINEALYNLRRERERCGLRFKIALAIHDSIVFQVPIGELDAFVALVPQCMSEDVAIRPRRLSGEWIEGRGPYHLDVDKPKIGEYWGGSITPERLEELRREYAA